MKKCPYCAEEIQDEAIVCKHCGRDLKGGASQVQIVQPRKTSPAAAGCAILLLLVGACWFITNRSIDQARESARLASAGATPPPVTLSAEQALQRDVTISGSWVKGGFGNVAEWNVSLRNTSKVTTWKDLQYETEYTGESGKRVHRNRGEWNIVLKPGQSRRIAEHNDGFIPQGAVKASIRLIGGVYDTLAPPAPKATPRVSPRGSVAPTRR